MSCWVGAKGLEKSDYKTLSEAKTLKPKQMAHMLFVMYRFKNQLTCYDCSKDWLSGENHQWILNLEGNFWWKARYLPGLNVSPHRWLISCKRKKRNPKYTVDKLDNTLTRWSQLMSNGHHVPPGVIPWDRHMTYEDLHGQR